MSALEDLKQELEEAQEALNTYRDRKNTPRLGSIVVSSWTKACKDRDKVTFVSDTAEQGSFELTSHGKVKANLLKLSHFSMPGSYTNHKVLTEAQAERVYLFILKLAEES